MEKAVFKATRKDIVHPKQKHVDTLIQMTLSGVSMEELFMLLQARFSEANWAISFKALIVVHILMHEGNGPVIYDYLIRHPNVLDMSRFRDRHNTKGVSEFEQSKNVRTYAAYLGDKVLAFKAIRIDHVSQKNPEGSQIYIKHPGDIKFLLLEVSTVQKQLHSVLKNRFDSDTLDNETTFSAFRYCLRDMLKLFQVMNQGVMKMLKVYFEMREEDMRRALDLYKRFVKLTDRADEYLKIARRFESIFGFTIPSLNHAPLSLSKALEGFLSMSPEERMPTINEMKRNAKKASPPQSAQGSANVRSAAMHSTAQRAKPDYGLRLKPEILAIGGETPSQAQGAPQYSDTTTSTRIKADSERAAPGAAIAAASTKAPSSSSILATKEIAKDNVVAELDFIDFFSSIDDDTAPVAGVDTAVPFAQGNAGGKQQQTHEQQQQQAGVSDFEAMFQALSNPFATSGGDTFSEPSTAGSISIQQPFVQASAGMSPFSAAPPTQTTGGYANVSANNPFRQSMYPTQQPDNGMAASQQSAMVVGQMAQMNMQQASYNPFAQRQTMYMDSSAAANFQTSMPFGTTVQNHAPVTNNGPFNGMTGFPSQQQQQQQHMQAATSSSSTSNGNFANFDVFK
ncbi:hypothetical protein EV175_000010 [Coemansia sp. RSA 1933]|nr:hypothetical protein EV175_000010 [Coemansia sp. RSA 1933]